MIWVPDASVALLWLLREEAHPNARAVLERMVEAPTGFAIPEIFLFEVFAVLGRLHPHAEAAFIEGVLPVVETGLFRQPMTADLARRAAPFLSAGLTGYDACYAALAGALSGMWLTFDAKAHRRLAGMGVSCLLSEGLPEGW